MKSLTIAICAAVTLLATPSYAQKEKAKPAAATDKDKAEIKLAAMPDEQTMMKNWQAYMTPGKEHKLIASWDGTWEGETTMWMTPGAPPSKSTGTATHRTIYNGLYQVSNYTGNFNGMAFEGTSTLAFDNAKKKFISTWIDNFGSGIMVMEGVYDEAAKTISFEGSCVDPTTGRNMKMREVFRIIDDNTQVMEMYSTWYDGKEYKSMEITYKRKS